jgi:hypothetical protein
MTLEAGRQEPFVICAQLHQACTSRCPDLMQDQHRHLVTYVVLVGGLMLSFVDMLTFVAREVVVAPLCCTKVYLTELLDTGVTVVVNVTRIVCFPPAFVTNTGGEKGVLACGERAVFFW